jgi:hypothetical protein
MKVKCNIPNGKSGDYRVESFTISEKEADSFNLRQLFSMENRPVTAGHYKRLKRNGTIVMSNTDAECWEFYHFVRVAEGDILINGLGLGLCVTELLKKDTVKSITVIEISKDVIKLVSSHIKDPRLTVICADALEWKAPVGKKYDYVWHDIWDNICLDNYDQMSTLHRRYGRRAGWQDSWARDRLKSMKREEYEANRWRSWFCAPLGGEIKNI